MSNEVKNVYESVPKKFLRQYHNPHVDEHQIKVPFRMCVIGSSGSMKTATTLFILSKMRNTFNHVFIYTRDKSEPLYEYLEDQLSADVLTIREGIGELPSLQKNKDGKIKDFDDPKSQYLLVFDDLVLERDQSRITEYFIRGRKVARGISLMYLSQSYYKIPKTIRLQCGYMLLKKLASTRDLQMILGESSLGVKKETLLEMYKYCTRRKEDFLLLDLDAEPERRFKHNLLEVLDAESFENHGGPNPSMVRKSHEVDSKGPQLAGASHAAVAAPDDDSGDHQLTTDSALLGKFRVKKHVYEN